MIIDDKLLEKLENLSEIKIEDEKKENIKNELSEILNFVENLNKINTEENLNIQKSNTPLREDEVISSNVADLVLNNAPKTEERFFIVPKIVE